VRVREIDFLNSSLWASVREIGASPGEKRNAVRGDAQPEPNPASSAANNE
jgi:hypothetical protein